MAELSLAPIFSDSMVLQREMAVPVWGNADPGTQITVTFHDQAVTTRADKEGHWRVELAPLKASDRPAELQVYGDDQKVVFEDVLVGEVWLFSGQSNMAFGLKGSANGEQAIAEADLPNLRVYDAPANASAEWVRSTPENAGNFAAVPFYYARHLQKELDMPVGMIECALGGSMIQTWISHWTLNRNPDLKWQLMDLREKYVSKEGIKQIIGEETFQKKLEENDGDVDKLLQDFFGGHGVTPAFNFESYGMPEIAPFAIRGFGWYQGESDAWGFPIALGYETKLKALINDWRSWWQDSNKPFLVVQLPHYQAKEQPSEPYHIGPWNVVMEAQWKVQDEFRNVYTAVTMDLGSDNIHPHRKQPVGERLSLLSQKYLYDQNVVARGPTLQKSEIKDGKVYLTFDHVAGGLVSKGSDKPEGFTIAGKDRHFRWADARIVDDHTVVCSNDEIPNPAAVRYAMTESGHTFFTLYNEAGLPAAPFRTDDWPMDTVPREQRSTKAVSTDEAPELDGELDDKVWQNAPKTDSLELFHTYAPAENQTEARFAYDNEKLYAAFTCYQDTGKLVKDAEKRDDDKIWNDDNVQLFLDVNHDKKTYARVAVNPEGTIYDGDGYNDGSMEDKLLLMNLLQYYRYFHAEKDYDVEVATKVEDDRWTVELAIPWKSLGLDGKPASGQTMGLQVTRKTPSAHENSEWATTGIDYNTGAMMPPAVTGGKRLYHGVSRFGTLTLE